MFKKSTHSFGANSRTKTQAKLLRKNQTSSEEKLWQILRNRNVSGLKFRRQHPLSNFIVDFYCHELKLVIEVDGEIHEKPGVKKCDLIRETAIKELGLNVMRFRNEDVYFNAHLIEKKIVEFRQHS